MFRSLRLGRFFGIDLYVHGTFWLLPLFVLLTGLSAGCSLAAAGAEVGFLFAVFGCVFLHEVGHALAARAYGVGTRDITLYPVGGVASLDRMPEKPGQEIAIALAGPAVNLVIAGALFAGFVGAAFLTPWVPDPDNALDVLGARLMAANLVLTAFNLLPVFPMDGGRVLRAALATRLTRVRATEVAAGVGAVAAGVFLVAGLVLPHFGLVLLAAVVWLLGQAELAGVRARAAAAEWEAAAPPAADGYTGLVWDETRRVWVQYRDGRVVGVIDPEE
ncbi:MAG: peptidase M50 [Isosphaera sp.]|nr:peptidase M50 [Isosphaera sp.]